MCILYRIYELYASQMIIRKTRVTFNVRRREENRLCCLKKKEVDVSIFKNHTHNKLFKYSSYILHNHNALKN